MSNESEFSIVELSALARSGRSTRRELKQKIEEAQLSEVRKYDLLTKLHQARQRNVFPDLKKDIIEGKILAPLIGPRRAIAFFDYVYQGNRAFYDLLHYMKFSRQARNANQ